MIARWLGGVTMLPLSIFPTHRGIEGPWDLPYMDLLKWVHRTERLPSLLL